MTKIIPLSRRYYKDLFNLVKVAEFYKGYQAYDQFCQNLDQRQGFTYWKDDMLVGCVQFSDFYPGNSVMIHAVFHPLHKAAMNRMVMKQVFNFVFNVLRVHRANTYSIIGLTDTVIKFILGMGFQEEGILREAVEIENKKYDLAIYGMLRGDCRWL